MTRGLGTPAMLRRQLAASRGTAVLLAAAVLLVTTVLVAAPRATTALVDADLAERLGTLSPDVRDPARSVTWVPPGDPATPGSATIDAELQALDARRDAAGADLRPALGDPELVLTRPRTPVDKGTRAPDVTAMTLSFRLDPRVADRVQVVEGRLPGPLPAEVVLRGLERPGALAAVEPLEVALSAQTAERMRWEVGEVRRLGDVVLPLGVLLTGTFEGEETDPVWSHLTSTLVPFVDEDGNVGTTVHGIAYADQAALPLLAVPAGMTYDAWFPVDPVAVSTADRARVLPQLRAFLTDGSLTSGLTTALEDGAERQDLASLFLRVMATGPAGAALGVLWLAGTLAVERRRPALEIARARGAGTTQIAVGVGVQIAAVTLPAAVVGGAVAVRLTPGAVRVDDVLVPVLAGLAPAVLAAGLAAAAAPALRRGPARPRWAGPAEAAVLVLAALAVLAVRQRGLAGSGSDVLVVAAPALLALAGALLTVRLLPVPLRHLARVARRRPGLTAHLGAARAARTPAGGLAALVALVLGVTVMTFSGAVSSTVRAGVERTGAVGAGADLRLDGPDLEPADVDAVRALDGVAEVAAVGQVPDVLLRLDRSAERVRVVTVDVADLAAVQAGMPLGPSPTDDLSAVAGALPALVAAVDRVNLARDARLDLGSEDDDLPLELVGEAAGVPGVVAGAGWVLVDRGALDSAVGADSRVDRLLVRLAPGADATTVAGAAEQVTGAELVATTPDEVSAEVRAGALLRGAQAALLAATALTALLCVAVVALALAVAGPERRQLLGVLDALGAPHRVRGRLLSWEVAPLGIAAGVTGTAVGLVLTALVLGAADLRLLVGGSVRPTMSWDVVTAAAVLATLAAAVAGTTAIAQVVARRRPAAVLREGEAR